MYCTRKTHQRLLGVGGMLLLLCLFQSNPGALAGELHAQQRVRWDGRAAGWTTSVMNSQSGHHGPISSQGQTECPGGYVRCGQRLQLCCPR